MAQDKRAMENQPTGGRSQPERAPERT